MKKPLPILSCNECGVCCLELGLPPFLGSEIYDLPAQLRDEVLESIRTESYREEQKMPCNWYDKTSRKCLHHENRPLLCRDFEMGSDSCLNFRSHYNII